jgi:hypothetical protein
MMSEKSTGTRKGRVLMGTQVAAGVAAIVAAAYGAHDLAHPDRPTDAEQVTSGQYRYSASDGAEATYAAVKPVADIKIKGGPNASKTSVRRASGDHRGRRRRQEEGRRRQLKGCAKHSDMFGIM